MNHIFVDQKTEELRGTKQWSTLKVSLLTGAAFIGLVGVAIVISPSSSPSSPPSSSTSVQVEVTGSRDAIPFRSVNGGMYVYANLGGIPHNMLLDTGASMSSVTVPIANALLARKRATIVPGILWSTIANGSVIPNQLIIVHTMSIGRHVLRNVKMLAGDDGAAVLLGLSELSAIGSFTIDQAHNQIRFN
jgi:predicted aspartyl protease